jgi:outer membrane biosynthesis protein TonB
MPEETEEEKRAAALKKLKEEEEKKAVEGGDDKKKKKEDKKKAQEKQEKAPEEEEKKEEKKEPPKPIKVWIYETSIHDLLLSLDKMSDYDFVLSDLGIMKADIQEEKVRLNKNDSRNSLGRLNSQ